MWEAFNALAKRCLTHSSTDEDHPAIEVTIPMRLINIIRIIQRFFLTSCSNQGAHGGCSLPLRNRLNGVLLNYAFVSMPSVVYA
jgi:hypothetical protein